MKKKATAAVNGWVTPQAVVVCDDIRREMNGKAILIGVYDGIRVPELPADIFLSFWMQFSINKIGDADLKFQVVGPHNVRFAEMGVRAHFRKTGDLTSLALGSLLIPLQLPGELKLQLKQGDGEWEDIKVLSVERGDVTPGPRPGAPLI